MNISFWLREDGDYHITTLYDVMSNPFKEGDIVWLNVRELYPAQETKLKDEYGEKVANSMIEKNMELFDKFRLKKLKLVEESKHLEFSSLDSGKVTIEYICEIVNIEETT